MVVRMAAGGGSPSIVLGTPTGLRDAADDPGSVARDVMCLASWPAALVPPTGGREPWFPGWILFPDDGTPTLAAAACPALKFAVWAGAEIPLLHAAGAGTPPPTECGAIAPPRSIDPAQHEWPAGAREFLDRAGAAKAAIRDAPCPVPVLRAGERSRS